MKTNLSFKIIYFKFNFRSLKVTFKDYIQYKKVYHRETIPFTSK